MRTFLTILLVTLSFGLAGCVDRASVSYGDKHDGYEQGPPPHAPAHGYRAKHGKHKLRYDSGLGAYVVLGYDDHFFLDNAYFRYRSGNWQISSRLDGGWRDAVADSIPFKLRTQKKYKKWDKKHDKGKKKKKDED